MPGYTANQLFPYPLMGETIDAASWQALANAIDASLVAANLLRVDALTSPTCIVAKTGSVAITVNTETNVSLTSNMYTDPSSMHSTSVNPDQVIVPEPGVYFVHGSVNLTATTTLTASKASITLNGTQVFAQQENPRGAATGWITDCNGLVLAMSAGDIIRLRARWSGTGTGGLANCMLHVARVSKW